MKATAKRKGLTIYEYAPTTIRKSICETGSATKQEVAKILAAKYPQLSPHLKVNNKWERNYYANIFDAIAVGLMCHEQLATAAAA